jgi:hypothetical protein
MSDDDLWDLADAASRSVSGFITPAIQTIASSIADLANEQAERFPWTHLCLDAKDVWRECIVLQEIDFRHTTMRFKQGVVTVKQDLSTKTSQTLDSSALMAVTLCLVSALTKFDPFIATLPETTCQTSPWLLTSLLP